MPKARSRIRIQSSRRPELSREAVVYIAHSSALMFAFGKEIIEHAGPVSATECFRERGEDKMKNARALLLSIAALAVFGCSSPQDRAYEAQEQVHEERLKLVAEYRKCVEEAGDDKLKAEACDQYLKAAEALK